MPYRFVPIGPNASPSETLSVVNGNFAQLDGEAVTKVFNGADGNPAVTIGRLSDGEYGLSFSDGETTFLRITKDGIVMNDGTNNRVLIGKDEGGF